MIILKKKHDRICAEYKKALIDVINSAAQKESDLKRECERWKTDFETVRSLLKQEIERKDG